MQRLSSQMPPQMVSCSGYDHVFVRQEAQLLPTVHDAAAHSQSL